MDPKGIVGIAPEKGMWSARGIVHGKAMPNGKGTVPDPAKEIGMRLARETLRSRADGS